MAIGMDHDLISKFFERRVEIMPEFHDSRLLHSEAKTKRILKQGWEKTNWFMRKLFRILIGWTEIAKLIGMKLRNYRKETCVISLIYCLAFHAELTCGLNNVLWFCSWYVLFYCEWMSFVCLVGRWWSCSSINSGSHSSSFSLAWMDVKDLSCFHRLIADESITLFFVPLQFYFAFQLLSVTYDVPKISILHVHVNWQPLQGTLYHITTFPSIFCKMGPTISVVSLVVRVLSLPDFCKLIQPSI